MIRILLVILFVSLTLPIYGQSVNRIEVSGILLSSNNDVEAVTIFNKSTNKGTITNPNGEFKLKVGLNDVIEISALQFQVVTVLIDSDIIKSKQLKIQLVEEVNQLDAVTLSSGLTGNIETDVSKVKNIKPIILEMGNMNIDFEYHDDKAFDKSVTQNHLKSIINPNARNYLPNIGKILGLIFNSKKELKLKKKIFVGFEYDKPKDLLSIYSLKYIQEQFEIPEEKIQLFIAFIETKGIKPELLKPENEILLIQYLGEQRNLFLKK